VKASGEMTPGRTASLCSAKNSYIGSNVSIRRGRVASRLEAGHSQALGVGQACDRNQALVMRCASEYSR
jgi:hypothetical protein